MDGALHGLNPPVFQILEQQNAAVSMNSFVFLYVFMPGEAELVWMEHYMV